MMLATRQQQQPAPLRGQRQQQQPRRRALGCRRASAEPATATTAGGSPSSSPPPSSSSHYIVQNVFQVKPDCTDAFEEVWRTRESRLTQMPGFVRFALLRCENVKGRYVSQTSWADEAAFRNWASSPQFRASHGEGKDSKRPSVGEMLEGPPSPQMYSTVTATEGTTANTAQE